MEKYIEGNKAAWEEAFDNRTSSWGADITERVRNEAYPFFYEEMKNILKQLDTKGKVIGQFCCNNGRELLTEDEEQYDPEHKTECCYSYFDHEWTSNEGMYYITQKTYHSKTFTDFTHPMSEIITGMCSNGIVVMRLEK